MQALQNALKNLFKIGVKKSTSSSNLIDVDFQGKTQKALLINPYGIQTNPTNDNPTALLADQANEESLVAFVFDIANREDLQLGEVAIGIPAEQARIFFREDGKIYFRIGLNEGGDFMARFNELKSGFDELKDTVNDNVTQINKIATHTHPVQVNPITGTGATTGIIPADISATPSTASIDDAKIEEIEVPEL